MSLVSDCCGANAWLGNSDLGLCGQCLEHCEFVEEE